jgi:hypothetical protein
VLYEPRGLQLGRAEGGEEMLSNSLSRPQNFDNAMDTARLS